MNANEYLPPEGAFDFAFGSVVGLSTVKNKNMMNIRSNEETLATAFLVLPDFHSYFYNLIEGKMFSIS